MSLLWVRPLHGEARFSTEERRLRDFLATPSGVSESAASLAVKLGMARGQCKRILEQLVQEGLVRRRDFDDIEPIYYRFPGR